MVLNDRSLTCQKDGLSNSLNLTNQDFYVRLVDEKNNSVLAGRSFSLARFSLPRSFLRPATQATNMAAGNLGELAQRNRHLADRQCILVKFDASLDRGCLKVKLFCLRDGGQNPNLSI